MDYLDAPGRTVTATMTIDRDQDLRLLHDHYAQPLWRYVHSLTGATAEADDIVQETMVRAWNNPHILSEPPEAVRGWMYTVARNLVTDRARSARMRHEHSAPELPERAAPDSIDRIFDGMVVQDALASLSPDHRAVILGAYYGGRNTAELASELGIAEGTVKSRLHYGLRALRLALQERGVTQ